MSSAPSPPSIDQFLQTVLDAIEQQEAKLLVWGLTDGRLSEDDLHALIDPLLDTALEQGVTDFLTAAEVAAELKRRALLVDTDDVPFPGVRSRMAETVRLLFRLRQLFPKHAAPNAWQQAPTLVSDFRFLWRRRRYPRRSTPVTQALQDIGKAVHDPSSNAALAALLEGRAETYQLAGFQVRAATRILERLEAQRSAATLVSAGTGSGKTLAFYLPALARTASHIAKTDDAWVKVLAIYPRTELLRDQFAEIHREARRLDGFLRTRGRRPIRIGALFQGTPNDAGVLETNAPSGWKRLSPGTTPAGFVCGYMPCPKEACGGDLVWLDADRTQGRERLVCRHCSTEVSGDEIALTRKSMRRQPPDILFTTTEMLNQRMADSAYRHLFGLRPQAKRAPEMVLLDEVHYYSGLQGAQTAYLLRRWFHLVQAPISFVGLSATLRDGGRFFARLTGLDETQVEEIAPKPAEMEEEGAEYLLAVRGDPVSRTSLLSTTIQTAMLIMRALDHGGARKSHGLYGHRTFVFTDDLDVNNRLYFSLLDAEGRTAKGEPDNIRHPSGPLAVLRRPLESRSRERYGQNWTLAEAIGHPLVDRKRIGRTSSKDPGVASGMDAIVATASLEVGFNDAAVGAVIQHKAPRGVAPFLQRKGRAGRTRAMRPWTVVVLSDYGRDRVAYQGYDTLFSPELPAPALPLSSRYIQRIQAVYALIDYLGLDGPDGRSLGNTWRDLAEPDSASPERKQFLVRRLADLLLREEGTDALAQHLSRALRLTPDEIAPLLWEYPRPVLTTAIPTALRRLSTDWRCHGQTKADYWRANAPLPEFIPPQLFSDLNLPEVQISLPKEPGRPEPAPETMPIAMAMRTFAAGRISKRFSVHHGAIRHWVGPADVPPQGIQPIEVTEHFKTADLGAWLMRNGASVVPFRVLRPLEIRPIAPDKRVGDTSNAYLIWHTQIVARRKGLLLPSPGSFASAVLITGIEAFLHSEQAPVEVRRFASGSDADIQVPRHDPIQTRFEYRHTGTPIALGFSLTVDALRFRLALPPDLWQRPSETSLAVWRTLRTARYFDLAWTGERLTGLSNRFARKWLAEIYFTALSHDALTRHTTLQDADLALAAGTAALSLHDVLETIFQSPLAEDEAGGPSDSDRLRRDLDQLLHDPAIRSELRELGRTLWEPPEADWEDWLRQRFKVTLGAATLEAIRNLCPEIGDDGLVLDIDPGPKDPGDPLHENSDEDFWITETTPGGTAHVETFLRLYADDPRRFYLLLEAALRPNDHELVSFQLTRFLSLVAGDEPSDDLVARLQDVRNAQSLQAGSLAMASLRQALRVQGFALFHGFVSALANRVVRPGTTESNDGFLLQAVEQWTSEEARLGVELDAKTIAYALSQDDAIDRVMADAGLPVPSDNVLPWRHNAIYGLLWPRGAQIRNKGLSVYNPFVTLPDAERLLVAEFLGHAGGEIRLDQDGWRQTLMQRLAEVGTATLACPGDQPELLAMALTVLTTNPVQSDYLSVYARIGALRRTGSLLEADLEVAEVAR